MDSGDVMEETSRLLQMMAILRLESILQLLFAG